MSNRNNRNATVKVAPVKKEQPLTAKALLNDKHPLHNSFMKFVNKKGVEPTKRQAAKFLQKYPMYRAA